MDKTFDTYGVSDRLIEARKAKNFTQTDLREASGLAISVISRIENDCSKVTMSNFYAYCKAVDADLNYIFYGEKVNQND